MTTNQDRLYELLPAIYRVRDAEQGYPLRALLRVIAEQVTLVEADINQLYRNWFIETAEDWVVPYLGELLGYEPVYEAGEPGDVTTPQERLRNKILIPRREVANTIRFRRRKGTLAVLELLAQAVAGWPSRAVEFYKLLGWTHAINHIRPSRHHTVNLRNEDALDRIDGPFEEMSHTIDIRRINSHRTPGRYNIPSVGLFVWRLKPYSVTCTSAYCLEAVGPNFYTFSVLGNDAPLYTRPEREKNPTDIAGEFNVPTHIRRHAFESHKADYYDKGKSLQIWLGSGKEEQKQLVSPAKIIPADLTDWQYRPKPNQIAVDPVLGRMVFSHKTLPKHGVWVHYHYGFSDDMGGGEYRRSLSQPHRTKIYRVGEGQRINDVLDKWRIEKPDHAVIEIIDSGVYVEPISIEFTKPNQSLQLRAANKKRPIIRLLDWQTAHPDSLSVKGKEGNRFTMDGLLITGRGVHIEGDLTTIDIRHCTLVPGWSLDSECEPRRPAEPSLELFNTQAKIRITHSIIGSIQVSQDEVKTDPIPIEISDTIVDATGSNCDDPYCEALGAPGWPLAHANLTVLRSTIFGRIFIHALQLAENSIFMGRIKVGRRQIGCIRFCYVTPDSRTPRRYNCQPDLVEEHVKELFKQGKISSEEERDHSLARERLRVRPRFNSTHYGMPTYSQLSHCCAEEIKRGADDESEMGAFHDLFQPQRAANLRVRLKEYTPAGMNAGIIYAS